MQWKFTEYQPPHTLDNPQGTIGGLNKKDVTPLVVLKRKREMALILQNSDLDTVEEKEPVVRVVVGCGGVVHRGSLGLRGADLGPITYYLLILKMSKRHLFSVALSTLVPSGLDWTAPQDRMAGVPFSLAMPSVTVAVIRTMSHG